METYSNSWYSSCLIGRTEEDANEFMEKNIVKNYDDGPRLKYVRVVERDNIIQKKDKSNLNERLDVEISYGIITRICTFSPLFYM